MHQWGNLHETGRGAGISQELERLGLDRRQFLHLGGAAVLGAAVGGSALAGCSTSTDTGASSDAPPKRGGTLTVGVTGGTASDTVNPLAVVNPLDIARSKQLFDTLVKFDQDAVPQLSLADEVTPDKSARTWTIRLRSDVTFHHGKRVTADDVIYSMRQATDPANASPFQILFAPVDVAGVKKVDDLTVQVPCRTPFVGLYEVLAAGLRILPTDFDPAKPVGTGPFKFDSFQPGRQSRFVANDDYWIHRPYLDALVIQNFADEQTQVNALLGGQVDAVANLSVTSANALKAGGHILVEALGGGWNPIFMRTDVAPFNDVRVREAMRLVIDRPQMLQQTFAGRGTLGNDLWAIFDPMYNDSLPQREQDLDRARFLLKQAGQSDLRTELVISNIAQGISSMAQVFAEQAKGAGVDIALRQVTPTELFGDKYMSWQFSVDYWGCFPYLTSASWATLPDAPFNETHFRDDEYVKLYHTAQATLDEKKRGEIVWRMQEIDYQRGGYIIPFFPPVLDGHSKLVKGLTGSKFGISFGYWDFVGASRV